MGKYPMRLVTLVLLASAVFTEPSHAIIGHVRVVFAKAGLIAGAGVGRGVLIFRGRDYRFGFGSEPGLHGRSIRYSTGRERFLFE
jgi:hypothetical protein